jgi:ligand-binding sensor domain-containing protein
MMGRCTSGIIPVLVSFLLAVPGALPNAHGQMKPPDPRNSVQALALGPDGTIYMGTFGSGIYKSRDSGLHWEAISEGLGDPYIMTLLVRPASGKPSGGAGSMIFAGTARFGVFRSRDEGLHWEKVNQGLINTQVVALRYDAKNNLYAATGQGVFRSRDHGDHWTPHNTGLDDVLVRSLIIDRKGSMYAGTGGKGLYKREAGQPGWERLTRGFEAERGLRENFIRVLTLGADGTVYAGTFDGGVYTSRDGGKNWNDLNQGLINQSIRAILVGEDGQLFLGTGKGIFTRSPKDTRWSSINGSLEDLNIQSMVIDRQGNIYAGTAQHLYKGSAKGDWVPLTRALFNLREGM